MLVKKIWNSLLVATILSAIVVAVSVQAATVTSANDFPSTLRAGFDANHEVVFTTPSGASEGDTITIEFDSEFDTSALIEDDIDIEDDAVDLSTAPDCSGSEEAGISIAGNIVTITICAGDGGAIAAASVVTIEIGDNATSSGTGTNQVTNPLLEGVSFISISGTFGDSGSIALPIGGDDSITVRALVDQIAPIGGGGGGGGGCGDTIPPIISNVIVSDVTFDSVTISWNTDEQASGSVDYGETVSYEIGTEFDNSLITSRSIDLTGLSEGTTYHLQLRSSDQCFNETTSADMIFQTLDETACIISNVNVVDITDVSARVTWDTDEPASSLVDYGLTSGYGSQLADSLLETQHSTIVTSLTPGTLYHYRIGCEDAFGNDALSLDDTFTTLSDLPPGNVSGLTANPEDQACLLTWTNPPDSDLVGIRVLECPDTFPSSINDSDCVVVFDGLAESYFDTGLINETEYFYGVFAHDGAGQFASGALTTCIPSALEEEVPEEEIPEEEIPEEEEPEEDVTEEEEPEEEVPEEEIPEEELEEEEVPELLFLLSPYADQVEFFVANLAIQLFSTSYGEVAMLGNRPLRVQLLTEEITQVVDHVQLNIGGDIYLMALNFQSDVTTAPADSAYMADITSPPGGFSHAMAVSIFFADGTTETIPYVARVLKDGYVFERIDGFATRLSDVTSTLLRDQDGLVVWDGSPYAQFNPVTTGADGSIAWYTPNGSYSVRAEKAGYETNQLNTFPVGNHIANRNIELVLIVSIPIEVEEGLEGLDALVTSVSDFFTTGLASVRAFPTVQQAARISSPILAVLALAILSLLAAMFGLWPFLQYLFTAPILFFWRRKRKGFGVVYNGISKIPIDLAIVRLYQLPEEGTGLGKLVRSRVTDRGGRYFFLVQPGFYRLAVVKPGFVFPSEYLEGKKDDGKFLDVYHGEPIEVKDKDAVITANIPMDPTQEEDAQAPKKIRRVMFLRKLQQVVAVIGIISATAFAIIQPTAFSISMVAVQIIVYLFVLRLAKPRKPKSWGIVHDKHTGRPLSNVVVRVFEPRYNKLLETRITDSKGRYSFLLGPNEYYSVYQKTGYEEEEVRPIDFTKNEEPSDLSANVKMYEEGQKPEQPEPAPEPEAPQAPAPAPTPVPPQTPKPTPTPTPVPEPKPESISESTTQSVPDQKPEAPKQPPVESAPRPEPVPEKKPESESPAATPPSPPLESGGSLEEGSQSQPKQF